MTARRSGGWTWLCEHIELLGRDEGKACELAIARLEQSSTLTTQSQHAPMSVSSQCSCLQPRSSYASAPPPIYIGSSPRQMGSQLQRHDRDVGLDIPQKPQYLMCKLHAQIVQASVSVASPQPPAKDRQYLHLCANSCTPLIHTLLVRILANLQRKIMQP